MQERMCVCELFCMHTCECLCVPWNMAKILSMVPGAQVFNSCFFPEFVVTMISLIILFHGSRKAWEFTWGRESICQEHFLPWLLVLSLTALFVGLFFPTTQAGSGDSSSNFKTIFNYISLFLSFCLCSSCINGYGYKNNNSGKKVFFLLTS